MFYDVFAGLSVRDEEKYRDCERLMVNCLKCERENVIDAPYVGAVSFELKWSKNTIKFLAVTILMYEDFIFASLWFRYSNICNILIAITIFMYCYILALH